MEHDDIEKQWWRRFMALLQAANPGDRISFADGMRCLRLDLDEEEDTSYGHSDPDWWKEGE